MGVSAMTTILTRCKNCSNILTVINDWRDSLDINVSTFAYTMFCEQAIKTGFTIAL